MKKRIISAMITILQVHTIQAFSAQNVQDIVDAFEKTDQNQEQRIQNLSSFNSLLIIAYQKVQSHIKPIITLVQNEVQNRLQEQEQNPEQSKDQDQNQTYVFPLTIQKWLDLHNNARKTPVSLHPDLMRSAQIWADHLSKNNIRSNTHRRIQGNYNYSDIENWFADLGIRFTNDGGTTFSENIAYNSVKCNTSNCDEALLTATDRSRKFFYTDEKQEQKPHYRAIVQEKFKYIGIGIAIKNGQYHIVIHYGTDITDAPNTQLTKN